ncbi:MAG: 23S rRNA (adenine(2503)-C(2))-methyltransferase RlmN [Desulfamplus sp.]|nr:23S rRNA (adenine(2503)-C(2))-methyltransferase RlmN [Desulfamplus sp.]
MHDITGMTRPGLVQWFEKQGMRSFRAGQVFKWIYIKQAETFGEMTDISKDVRQILSDNFTIPRLRLEASRFSADGTEKLLFGLRDGNRIESVLIPQKDHFTLCISSQAGCAQGCRFCLTAKCGLKRSLTTSEIVAQVRDARRHLETRGTCTSSGLPAGPLSNIVFMGMGEPLANFDAVMDAIETITDSDFGLKFSPRRVTLSTCGLVPEIKRLDKHTDVNLAISLNATDDATRSMLMPVNRLYPIAELLEACRDFRLKPRSKITFEYILIKDINDGDQDAKKLVKLLSPLKAKVNIIPFNEHELSDFKRPSPERVSRFVQILLDRRMTAIIRKSKGDDICAACGQLQAEMLE